MDDLGGRRANTAQALAQRRHPVASSEAQNVLNWAMCPAWHRHIPMAMEMAGRLHVFYVIVDSMFAQNHS